VDEYPLRGDSCCGDSAGSGVCLSQTSRVKNFSLSKNFFHQREEIIALEFKKIRQKTAEKFEKKLFMALFSRLVDEEKVDRYQAYEEGSQASPTSSQLPQTSP
jgi:hypothetical protein